MAHLFKKILAHLNFRQHSIAESNFHLASFETVSRAAAAAQTFLRRS